VARFSRSHSEVVIMKTEIVDIPGNGGRARYGDLWKKLLALPPGKALRLIDMPRGMLAALRMRAYYRWPDGSVKLRSVKFLRRDTDGVRTGICFWLAPANDVSIPA
jgi:hypothetical protein